MEQIEKWFLGAVDTKKFTLKSLKKKENEDFSPYLGVIELHFAENNLPPTWYWPVRIQSAGFYKEKWFLHFPLGEHKTTIYIKKRRWKVVETGKRISNIYQIESLWIGVTLPYLSFLYRFWNEKECPLREMEKIHGIPRSSLSEWFITYSEYLRKKNQDPPPQHSGQALTRICTTQVNKNKKNHTSR